MEQLTLRAIRTNLGLSADEMAKKVGLKNGYQWYRRERYEKELELSATVALLNLTGLKFEDIKLK